MFRMYRSIPLLLLAALLPFAGDLAGQGDPGSAGGAASASNTTSERQKLSGPRFGFTVFTGDVADRRRAADLEPIMTQFGWHFETRIVSTSGGQAVMEWIPLVGGVEQSELNLSLAWITGLRSDSGVEFGVGPNFSANKDEKRITTSMIMAAGVTLPFDEIQVPVNLAVGIARGGPRITMLTGWTIRGG